MSTMDWPRVCSLLAHELRSPSAVIAGYARMLSEGRLSGHEQELAYAQIERAANRISAISRQASDLARWLSPTTDVPSPLLCSALMSDAIGRCTCAERVKADPTVAASSLWIPTLDRQALAGAIATAIDAVSREVPEAPITVTTRTDGAAQSCDIVIGPPQALANMTGTSHPPHLTEWLGERGGMGLGLVLSAAIVLAHGGQLRMYDGHRDVLSVRLQVQREAA